MAPADPRDRKTTPEARESADPLDHVEIDDLDAPDDDGLLGGLPDAVRDRLEALVPELVKRTFAAGMGAVFSTEEGIRKVTRELKLPKEVAGYLMDTAGNTKDEFVRILAREVREFLQTVNLSEEIARMLTLLSFEIKTEIRFIPNDEKFTGVEPDVKASVKLKRPEKDDAGDGNDGRQGEPKSPGRRRLRRRSRG